jgi:hypothetical protein
MKLIILVFSFSLVSFIAVGMQDLSISFLVTSWDCGIEVASGYERHLFMKEYPFTSRRRDDCLVVSVGSKKTKKFLFKNHTRPPNSEKRPIVRVIAT